MTTNKSNPWLLPEGIEEILPPDAARLEKICRSIIDNFQAWGYQLVIPPMLEYLDSLLTGTGKDLELQTFKLTDLMSGRLMGIRADTTPQVARIDAHNLKRETPSRLCYLGTVLHTRSMNNGESRSPIQLGAELYGHAGIESDVEIMCLMLSCLGGIGLKELHIDVGHVGIYQALVKQAGLNEDEQSRLFDILQRKAKPELDALLANTKSSDVIRKAFSDLIDLNGKTDTLQKAKACFADCGEEVLQCIAELESLNQQVKQRIGDAPLFFDLAELRGYHYHTGITFAAYVPGKGSGIAFGGRYNNIGESFGRARPATGFSTDVKTLMSLLAEEEEITKAIFAPWVEDNKLDEIISALRAEGEIVISELPGQTGSAVEMNCDRELVLENNNWTVKPLN